MALTFLFNFNKHIAKRVGSHSFIVEHFLHASSAIRDYSSYIDSEQNTV